MTRRNAASHPDGDTFGDALLRWFDQHGRHDLPWQHDRTAYRVWLSEIMLQQTQVTTVIPYFERFTARFPNVSSLAASPVDAVLALWSGLGYYARARNLHRAAQRVVAEFNAELPRDIELLQSLPGIGRSTAGAILAQAHELRHPILDGNVKRVLARHHAIAGWPGNKPVETQMWQLAEQHTPHDRLRDYTQAIMDLGATVCTRSRPRCEMCPVRASCAAYASDQTGEFPQAKPKKSLPQRNTTMLALFDTDGRILLQRRPPTGIWGGLWSLPECAPSEDIAAFCTQRLGLHINDSAPLPPISHTFSHFVLHIAPHRAHAVQRDTIMDAEHSAWYNLHDADALGLPAPVKRLLTQLDPKERHEP